MSDARTMDESFSADELRCRRARGRRWALVLGAVALLLYLVSFWVRR